MNTRSTLDVSANSGRRRTVLSRSASPVHARTVHKLGGNGHKSPRQRRRFGKVLGSREVRRLGSLLFSVSPAPCVSQTRPPQFLRPKCHIILYPPPAPAQVHASGVVLSFFVVPPTDPYSAHPTTRNRLTTTHQIRRAVTWPFGLLPIAASGYGSGAGLRSGTTDPGVSGKLRPHPTSTTSTIGGTFTRHVILPSTSPR